MAIRADEIASVLKTELENFDRQLEVENVGKVLRVGDSIATVYGLSQAMMGELLEFPHDVRGMVLNLEENSVGRGGDGGVDDLQDVFDPSDLFGAREDTRFLRTELGAAVEILDRDTLQLTGVELSTRAERFDGRDDTASDFTRLRADGLALLPVGLRHTLAFRGRIALTRDVSGEVPFTHLPSLGDEPGSRAYSSGRFRDRDLFALGSELRYEVWRDLRERGRAEGYVFWEEGGVGPSLDDIPDTYSSYGVGLLLLWTGQVLGDAYLAFGDDGARVSASVSLESF